MTTAKVLRSPVSQEVCTELERVVHRWRQLPLDHALPYADLVRALVQSLADQVAAATGASPAEVPDHGPGALMDQLTVMVYDASAEDRFGPTPALTSQPAARLTATLAEDLVSLRRGLR